MDHERETVAVAGASGYVGSALGRALARRFHTVGLSRTAREASNGYATWRAADLFSLSDAERALEGADLAVYLVHSMLPSDRLAQGRFEDFDLLCADNFARAAKTAGVRQIVYLGGLVPDASTIALSRHLASRLETEHALAAHGVPVTTLRAGLVIGPGGSSFTMMERLVRRLPMMVCPAWTQTQTQPVALDDVVRALDGCLGREDVLGGTYDLGCPEVLSYRDMMQATARALGVRRPMMRLPFLTTGLSRLWVSLVTGAPKELVAPLIQSLAHPMVARDLELQAKLGIVPTKLDDALRATLTAAPDRQSTRRSSGRGSMASARSERGESSHVRSIQRMALPAGRDAAWVAREYVTWLPRALRSSLRVVTTDVETRFVLAPFAKPLLVLRPSASRSTPDRQLLYVTGGMLADSRAGPRARLEFRTVNGGAEVLAAVHDFVPRLPWPIYVVTQAIVHLIVMHLFGGHLARIARSTPGGVAGVPTP